MTTWVRGRLVVDKVIHGEPGQLACKFKHMELCAVECAVHNFRKCAQIRERTRLDQGEYVGLHDSVHKAPFFNIKKGEKQNIYILIRIIMSLLLFTH